MGLTKPCFSPVKMVNLREEEDINLYLPVKNNGFFPVKMSKSTLRGDINLYFASNSQ